MWYNGRVKKERHSLLSRRQFLVESGLALAAGCMACSVRAAASPETTAHEALFYEKLDDRTVRCFLCPRRCVVPAGGRGYCRVRENRGGTYYTLVYNRPVAVNRDPIEKKPFFHVYPASKAFSIATVGCNIHCKFCQNWDISQARPEDIPAALRTPQDIAAAAAAAQAKTIAYTYSEPTIFYEYMADCARAGRERGVESVVVSNGFIGAEAQKALFPLVKAIKVDLKAFTQKFYGEVCDGFLQPVLDGLKRIVAAGTWCEIVVLLIPTLNDNADDLRRMAEWVVKELGPDVPVHFTRYHPMYKMRNIPPTPSETLLLARQIALAAGIHYVYTGNLPGLEGQDTFCPQCKRKVLQRYGYSVPENHIRAGKCEFCGATIAGIWT
jgi:pyruvate formate lyase activating enzyme